MRKHWIHKLKRTSQSTVSLYLHLSLRTRKIKVRSQLWSIQSSEIMHLIFGRKNVKTNDPTSYILLYNYLFLQSPLENVVSKIKTFSVLLVMLLFTTYFFFCLAKYFWPFWLDLWIAFWMTIYPSVYYCSRFNHFSTC